MPNAFKYSTGSETLALKKGNFYIGTGDVGKGPTSSTGYYNGITPPSGGYTIYLNKETGGPSIYTASNDEQLISLTNSIAGESYTGVNECLVYFAGQTDKICVNRDYEGIVTDGLILNLDAGFTPSYPRSGTTWGDISLSGNNGTLINGPTFSGDSIVFDGVNDYVSLTSTDLRFGGSNSYTLDFFIKVPHSTVNQTIFSNGNLITPGNGIWFFKRRSGLGNTLTFHGYSTNPRINLLSTNIIPDNDICSVSLTFNGVDTYNVYINGQLENSINTNPIVAATGNSFIGAINGTGSFFGGNIYSTKIYNIALTSSEVLQNYNATKGRFGL